MRDVVDDDGVLDLTGSEVPINTQGVYERLETFVGAAQLGCGFDTVVVEKGRCPGV